MSETGARKRRGGGRAGAAARRGSAALEQMAEAGYWRIGLTGATETTLAEALPAGPVAIVLGAEGEGMRQNIESHCDALARLPIGEEIESLNVSTAVAVSLYAITNLRG